MDVLQEKHPDMHVPCMENTTCVVFKDYKEVSETMNLGLLEDNVTWVASKLSGNVGALGAEAIDTRNCLLCFGCSSEDFRVVVAELTDWMANPPPPPWAAYHALTTCRLDAQDKRLGLRPVGIVYILHSSIAKLIMRATGD